ncbi:hypothetical protein HYT53_04685 [Candidatus Woesearchaeota archaeon]|nr:hypothetical protein [Candidatus Woesearchaeota archaeon]
MAEAKIKVLESPYTTRTAILSLKRAHRGGLVEAIDRTIEESRYFDIKPYMCDIKESMVLPNEFMGLPYEEKPCVLRPGNEAATTREFARVDSHGNLIVHPNYIFPGERGWLQDPWVMRVIENKNPLVDREDFFTGEIYENHRESGVVDRMDAKGKDWMIIPSPYHIVPVYKLDFETLTIIEQIFTARELKDPDIMYVVVGSNNAGLPKKVMPPFLLRHNYNNLADRVRSMMNGHANEAEKDIKALEELKIYSEGYYEPAGDRSGNSQTHPHDRVISLPLLSKWVEEGYKRTEEKARSNGRTSFYDYLKKANLVIEEGKYFALVADPVPEFNGGLLVISRYRQNITEMDESELKELGQLRRLGRVILEILYNGVASNDYTIQTFNDERIKYSNTRFSLSLVPRKSVQAVLELSTKIVGLDTDPKELAGTMKYLKERIIRQPQMYQTQLANRF